MRPVTDVLIGYEPGHHGGDALELGRLFSESLGARPVVVSTMPWPNQLDDAETQDERVAEALADDLDAAATKLEGLGVQTRAMVSASPALTLDDLAEADPEIGLIALGSSHRGAVGRTLLGSVGESLMHGAPCAVAVAPAGYGKDEEHELRSIAVAFDGSAEARAALATAVELASRTGAQLAVIAVADYPTYGYSTAWTVVTAGPADTSYRGEQEHWLDIAREQIPEGIGRDEILLVGNAATELATVSGAFDLLVTGSRAYGPLRRTLLGSTTRKLIRDAACPVLVLPRGSRTGSRGLSSDSQPAVEAARS